MSTSGNGSSIVTTLRKAPSYRHVPEAEIEAVDGSGLFDEQYYSRVSGSKGDRRELIRLFLMCGKSELLSPSLDFDVAFYRHTNADVVQNGMNSLLHYICYGHAEGRYPTQRRLSVDATKIESSGLFDHHLFAHQYDLPPVPGFTDIETYLVTRHWKLPATQLFDEDFYTGAYDDVRGYRGKPLLHYVNVGRPQDRIWSADELQRRKLEVQEHFDASYYLAQFPLDEKPSNPLDHYLLHGSRLRLDPAPNFSEDYYTRRYPDLNGYNPFLHFIRHGRDEGRTGRPDSSQWFVRGKRAFDLAKPTIVVASHEASRTGAPLVGLMVGAKLSEQYNVIAALGKSGPLKENFLEYSCLAVIGTPSAFDAEYLLNELKNTHRVGAILLNSVETCEYAVAAFYAGIPSVALLHEFPEYTLPAGKFTLVVETADRVVVPAELIRESLQRDVTFHRGSPVNNVVVRPQGYLPQLPQDDAMNDLTREQVLEILNISNPQKTRIVLGVGHVQMRKGVDLFVQTAAETRELWGDDVRFVWVGSGYAPESDLNCSVWVASLVRRLNLEDHVFFLPHQASLDVLFDLADVFYLPSRLDPFPNVVLDAFKAGKAIVCFERATGVADMLRNGDAEGAAVGYCNVGEAAQALIQYMNHSEHTDAASNGPFVEGRFDFSEYVAFLEDQLEVAKTSRRELIAVAQRIKASGAFDGSFHCGTPGLADGATWRAILDYAARGLKGVSLNNPRPGFSEGLYRSAKPTQVKQGPALDHALAVASPLSAPPTTHRCVVLDDGKSVRPSTDRVALHLHLHYADMASDIMERLTAAECPLDLFVTTTSPEKCRGIEYSFRKYKLGNGRIIEVQNRGRDIGPLLTTAVRTHLRSGRYDVIGHLHGKRSVSVDRVVGDRWRNYLMETLLGNHDNLLQVLSIFAADPKVGLVFAEDRHCVGWTKNRVFAEKLASNLRPRPILKDFPFFPLGTMFWTRPAVLEPLWQLGLEAADFPGEPVPYDGSILHAIERMLPAICESTDHSWCTVYRNGTAW